MYRLVFEQGFKDDYQRVKRQWPGVSKELQQALDLLRADGRLPEEYGAHELVNHGGNYNRHIDFHLSDGVIDVVVLYMPYKTNPTIRFVRMGTHAELFQVMQK